MKKVWVEGYWKNVYIEGVARHIQRRNFYREKRKLLKITEKPSKRDDGIFCPCGGILVEKTSKYDNSKFMGCYRFPVCTHTEKITK